MVGGEFFAEHSVADLAARTDHWLEAQGRLGTSLRELSDPNRAIFYTSGRASNEAAFLYGLFARRLGTNNLPDCSNMCHESSGVALGRAIGIGKGTRHAH